MRKTGLADYAATPGYQGVQVLMRTRAERALFTVISYWASLDAIKAFAGDRVRPTCWWDDHPQLSR